MDIQNVGDSKVVLVYGLIFHYRYSSIVGILECGQLK